MVKLIFVSYCLIKIFHERPFTENLLLFAVALYRTLSEGFGLKTLLLESGNITFPVEAT